ncbi:hypothetical protein FNV43_RR11114 [Rhamnella rubrinervis]|uniref:Uncharacterized protein n=1 Tax=Rhamnella rubrinervis TaxID=2594499 RepID=A0A8K0H4Z8_9ROSA|nr:hypothetical protein FNV43_RR11114 [Rhamnella rubrinervis]
MFDFEGNEEYQMVLLEKPRTLEVLLAKRKKLNLLRRGGKENPIVMKEKEDLKVDLDEDSEEDPKEDPEEDPEEDPKESEPIDEETEIQEEPIVREMKIQQDNEVIEVSPECKSYFEEFGNIKRKRNLICSRPLRPRPCKKEKDLPFDSKVIAKPLELVVEEMRMVSTNRKLERS